MGAFRRKTLAELREPMTVTNDFQPIGERFEQMAAVPKKTSGAAQRPLAYKRIALIQNKQTPSSSTFGRVPIVRDDDVDSRTHYAAFMNCMDLNDNTIWPKMLYDCERLRASGGDGGQEPGVRLSKYRRKAFHLFMSPSYMKQTFDLEVDNDSDYRNMQRFQMEMKNVLTMDVDEMIGYKNGGYLNGILTGGLTEHFVDDGADCANECGLDDTQELNSTRPSFMEMQRETMRTTASLVDFESSRLTDQSLNSTQPVAESTQLEPINSSFPTASDCTTFDTMPSQDSNILAADPSSMSLMEDAALQCTNGDDHSPNGVRVSSRHISEDEGLGGSFSSLSVCSDPAFSPVVELFDIFSGIGKSLSDDVKRKASLTLDAHQMNEIFGVRQDCVHVTQRFQLPGALFEREIPLRLNVLGLPEAKLRRKKLFCLPVEFNIWKNSVGLSKSGPITSHVLMYDLC